MIAGLLLLMRAAIGALGYWPVLYLSALSQRRLDR